MNAILDQSVARFQQLQNSEDLKAPLRRVTGPDIPVPASPPLERFYIPDEHQLTAAVKEIL
ncbi:MAG: hypothetical protein KFF50_11460 [Desulfatitalea sp.]|nr:hypothetical protein [Desulfatitalea sp.]